MQIGIFGLFVLLSDRMTILFQVAAPIAAIQPDSLVVQLVNNLIPKNYCIAEDHSKQKRI